MVSREASLKPKNFTYYWLRLALRHIHYVVRIVLSSVYLAALATFRPHESHVTSCSKYDETEVLKFYISKKMGAYRDFACE